MNHSPIPIGQTVQITGACLICHQLKITHVDAQVFEFVGGCPTCRMEAQNYLANFVEPSVVSLDDAIPRMQELLQKAKLPLICGLVDQPCDVQEAAIDLAQRTDAAIDWTSNSVPLSIQNAKQETGDVSCTYGEIKERCDLVVYWDRDFSKKHPIFIERFAKSIPSLPVDGDRNAQLAALRGLRSRHPATPSLPEHLRLKSAMDQARYPVIVVDDDAIEILGDDGTLSLFRYVRSQNDINHCRLVHLSHSGNAYGIQSALTSRAGGPFGITYRSGEPIYRGREFTTHHLLKTNAVDLLILVGSPHKLPKRTIPPATKVIWLNDSFYEQPFADVNLPIAKWGFDKTGRGVRNDGIAVQRESFINTQSLDAAQVLNALGR